MQDGKGTFTWANGAVYEGSWKTINVMAEEFINGAMAMFMTVTGKTTVPMDRVL